MENTLDKKYTDLLQKILNEGVVKKDRTGTGTKSIFGYQIRHNMKEGFPLLTTKKMAWKSMVVELIWFLRGDTNIKFLVDNGCNIWVGDAYKNYLKNPTYKAENVAQNYQSQAGQLIECPTEEEFIEKIKTDNEFAKKWGELGPVYGKQWRRWDKPRMEPKGFDFDAAWEINRKFWDSTNGSECGPSYETFCYWLRNKKEFGLRYGYHKQIDQIRNSIDMLRNDPDSRRNIVSAWNVADINEMVLPPCHNFFQFYTRELNLDERAALHENPELFYQINGSAFSIGDSIEDSSMSVKDREWLHSSFDEGGIPKRAVSLMWNQRSVDTFLGLPFNIASYGLLLEIVAKEVNMVPDELIGNLGDTHLYLNHLEQAKEQIGRELTYEERYDLWFSNNYETGMEKNYEIKPDFDNEYYTPTPKRTREPYPLPSVELNDSWKFSSKSPVFADTIELDMIKLVGYKSHPAIKAPLSN